MTKEQIKELVETLDGAVEVLSRISLHLSSVASTSDERCILMNHLISSVDELTEATRTRDQKQ